MPKLCSLSPKFCYLDFKEIKDRQWPQRPSRWAISVVAWRESQSLRYADHRVTLESTGFSCGTVCVCPQLPYRGNDMIFWIFPIVPCHAFCMWHWPVGRNLDWSFIWGHHHLSEYMDVSRQAEYFIACYTVLPIPNKVETAVHGCNCWLSVWTLSCRCPVKLFTQYQPCIIVCYS